MTLIYLDNNSTTPISPEVVETLTECLGQAYLNPASQHQAGRAARKVLQRSKQQIARHLGLSTAAPDKDQLIITSGGTESNNLAIRGLVRRPGHVLVSCIEHPSALVTAESLQSFGCEVEQLPVSPGGHVVPAELARRIRKDTRLVCVMMGNNEVGTLQPISELASICQELEVPLHTDAVQVVGKLPVHFRSLGVTSMSLAAHKFHGPRGIGALALRAGVHLDPFLLGGSQQLGLRPGTEPVCLVVAMAKALDLCLADAAASDRVSQLRDRLQNRLLAEGKCVVNGDSPRLPHTLNVSFEGIDRQAMVMALDMHGVACSTGSACTSGSSEPSHVLLGMGCPSSLVDSSIRLSLSRLTTETEVDLAAERILLCESNLRNAQSPM